MGRPIFCRWCEAEDTVSAGEFPATCAICGNVGRWNTVKHGPLLERRKRPTKGPHLPFDLTTQDYKLFLRRIKVSTE